MARDEAAAGLLDQLTDTHLAERARYGERIGFDELYRRHAGTVAAYATVLTGQPNGAPDVVARAIPAALDAIANGGYSADEYRASTSCAKSLSTSARRTDSFGVR